MLKQIITEIRHHPEESELRIRKHVHDNYELSDFMACYCNKISSGGWAVWRVLSLNFKDYDIEKKDDNNYCYSWYGRNFMITLVNNLSMVIIIVLNALIAQIF